MSTRAENEKAEILDLVVGLGETVQNAIADTLREYDVPSSPSAATTIRIIATVAAPLTPRELAMRLDRDPSTVSLIADKLEQAGVIAREAHPEDGRKRVLVLTDRGRELWAVMRDRVHASVPFDRLTPDERPLLRDLLSRMR